MCGHHAIPAGLDDGDLYIGVKGGCGWGLLGEKHNGCCSVNEGVMI
jgi:hypothetical protein